MAVVRGRSMPREGLFVLIFHSISTIFGLPSYLTVCNFVCKTLIKPQNASNMKQQEGKNITKILIFLYCFKGKFTHTLCLCGSFLLIIQVPMFSNVTYLTWTLFLLLLCHPYRIQVIQLKTKNIGTNQAYQTNLRFTLFLSHKQGKVVSNQGPQRKRRKGDTCTAIMHPKGNVLCSFFLQFWQNCFFFTSLFPHQLLPTPPPNGF